MQDFLIFTSALMSQVCGFLMSEPIVWFVGVFLLLAVAQTVKYIMKF